jgi:serine-type D-Ala-D-Ala carboxypeptidase (penicillin-binding protein 5/6)
MLDEFKQILSIENRTKYFVHLLICSLAVAVAVFALLIIGSQPTNKVQSLKAQERADFFENLPLEGKGIVVFDVLNNREIFSKNPDLPLPLASLTKVMTAITAEQNLDADSKIAIIREYLAPEGDSRLIVGDYWKAKDLRDFTLLTSSNDGAFALASVMKAGRNSDAENAVSSRKEFIKEMNETALKIGLLNSKFFNEHGLDRETDQGGAYGSAYDMAILFKYALKNHPQILEATKYKKLEFSTDGGNYLAENTNIIANKIPNLIASKTGFTELAGGNLVVAFDAGLGRPIIISVLGSSEQGRFSDVLQLVEASLKYIQNN